MRIGQLRANHIEQPLGMMMDKPVFSWVVEESTGKKQSWAQVRVASDEAMTQILHDSGRAALSSLGYEADLPLCPRTRYYWQVTVEADDGDSGTSETGWFETGKQGEEWLAQWIAMPGDSKEHPVMRHTFALSQPVRSARLYICGLGLYEAQINGKPVTDEHFAPFYDSYHRLIQYQTWDVTELLGCGENEISALLGGGWYCGRFGFGDGKGCLYGERMQLIAELRVTLEDGTQTVIGTDESWQCRRSPVLMSSIYDGEIWDANLEQQGEWLDAEIVPAPQGRLVERISPRVAVTQELPVKEILHTPAGELVLDFGQVATGWASFTCDLPAGETAFLQYGELLQHDCFYNENLRSAKAEYTYISAGLPARVRPHFTFYGFRYVKVEGMTEEQILAANFTAQVIHSDLQPIGTLETSREKVNRLIENARWSQRDNFLDIPTDCPQRDERMGWTGDAQVFCATASYNMHTPAFYRKYMKNMVAEQECWEGAVPFVVPDVYNASRRRDQVEAKEEGWSPNVGSCAWADAATVIPWTVYQFCGDKALLREMYPSMKAWVDWIRRRDVERCGDRYLWLCGFHFADWLALDNPDKDSCFGGTDVTYVASAYYYYSATLTAKAAAALGYDGDAAYYADLAQKIKAAFREEFFTPTGRCAAPTQTGLLLGLWLGLTPEEYRERNLADLKAKLDARNIHLDTGFVGTPLLCPVLSENGLHNYAVTLLLQEDYPSWLYEVNMGATTIWERWNSVMPNGLVSDTGMNSMNHYSYGSVLEWMYRTLAGLNPSEEAPGFRKAVIAPRPDERFDHITCVYDSASGRYEASWKRENGKIAYRVTVPFDCEADVNLPGLAPMTLTAGSYEFTA